MTATTIETGAGLSGPVKAAVVGLLYRLGDDELVMGHRNSEWTGLGPILEADIAFSSMSQDEIGHAAAYYRLLHELGEPDPDSIAFRRTAEQYRCCDLVTLDTHDWAVAIVRQFLYDSAESLRLTALSESRYKPLAALTRKLAGEEKYHLMHGRSWIARLGPGTDESHGRVQAALTGLLPHALGMFEPPSADEAALLEQAGICPREEAVRDDWLATVRRDLSAAGLSIDPLPEPIFGSRSGRHVEDLARLIDDMTKVFRIDPAAKW